MLLSLKQQILDNFNLNRYGIQNFMAKRTMITIYYDQGRWKH